MPMDCEGYLHKEGGGLGLGWKKRWFVLNGAARELKYYDKQPSADEKKPPTLLGTVDVVGGRVVREPRVKRGHGIVLFVNREDTANRRAKYLMHAANAAEEFKWLAALQAASAPSPSQHGFHSAFVSQLHVHADVDFAWDFGRFCCCVLAWTFVCTVAWTVVRE
jgi:hypothetical protein